jgi:thiamine-phosphate pyrophosphorylase
MTAACRLYLFTPPLKLGDLDVFAARLDAVLAAGDFASVLVRIAPGAEGDAKPIVARLAETSAARDIALLVENDPRLAARSGADGAHVVGVGVEFTEALSSLKPERIVGVGGLKTRDDAMNAGESGADYVMFGEPRKDGWTPPLDETLERAGWWAEIFETPCVAFSATLEGAGELAAAGADFVALGDAIWGAQTPEIAAAEATKRIAAGVRTRL